MSDEQHGGRERVDRELWDRRHELIYEIDLSTLYHRKRERMFDTVDRFAKAIAVIGGSAAVAKLMGPFGGGGEIVLGLIAAAIAATSAFSLVFAFSERARRHAELAKAFGVLGAELTRAGHTTFDENDLDTCEAQIRSPEATEPASLGALVQICQNQIATAQGRPDYVSTLRWYQYLLAHVWDFQAPPRPFEPAK